MDYRRMEFDPTVKKPMLEEYPKLARLVNSQDDKMIRYVILMYDSKSPIKDLYPDLEKRKDVAGALAGYEGSIESLKSLTVDLGPYDELLDMISQYLQYQNSRLWTMIVTNEQSFYEYQRRIMAEVGGDADRDALSAVTLKTKLLEAMDDIDQRLSKYYAELTGSDSTLEDSLTKRRRLSPESIAKR
jgi:hypothetical protein